MKLYTCTKKDPITDKEACRRSGCEANRCQHVCHTHHPDTITTVVNQKIKGTDGFYYKHKCPHCNEEWHSPWIKGRVTT